MKYIIFPFFFFFFVKSYSQNKASLEQKQKFFITAGYGLAGSFFVRSYDEFAPIQNYKVFYKKHFLGVAQNLSTGINFRKNYELRFGINFQHFTRKIVSRDTLNNVTINLNHDIHHRDYMWYAAIDKKFPIKKHIFSTGLGIYYLRSKQEEIEIYFPNYFENIERDYHLSNLEEGGVFGEFSYEYRFQTKVNLGIRTQFYYTLSAGTAESITLYPFIKINL